MSKFIIPSLAACALGLVAFTQPAFAHAKLLSSAPEADATVPTPQEIVLTFSQPVQPVHAKLTDDQTQATTELAPPTIDGATLHYQVGKALAPGKYELSFRAVTPDTHPAAGTIVFTVSGADKAK